MATTSYLFPVNRSRDSCFPIFRIIPEILIVSKCGGPDLTDEKHIEKCRNILQDHVERGECGSLLVQDIRQLSSMRTRGCEIPKKRWRFRKWEEEYLEAVEFSFIVSDATIAACRKLKIPEVFPFLVRKWESDEKVVFVYSMEEEIEMLKKMNMAVLTVDDCSTDHTDDSKRWKEVNIRCDDEFWNEHMKVIMLDWFEGYPQRGHLAWETNQNMFERRDWEYCLEKEYTWAIERALEKGNKIESDRLKQERKDARDRFYTKYLCILIDNKK